MFVINSLSRKTSNWHHFELNTRPLTRPGPSASRCRILPHSFLSECSRNSAAWVCMALFPHCFRAQKYYTQKDSAREPLSPARPHPSLVLVIVRRLTKNGPNHNDRENVHELISSKHDGHALSVSLSPSLPALAPLYSKWGNGEPETPITTLNN